MPTMRDFIDAPPFASSPFGLLDVVRLVNSRTPHWMNGVTYQDACLNAGSTTYDECIAVTGTGAPPPPPVKSNTTELETRAATAFTVFTEFDCSPVGNDEALEIATRALEQTESWQVERAFWTGRAGGQEVVFPHLAANAGKIDAFGITLQTAATVPVTGTHDVAHGLGLLEQQLADCYNGVGVIHVSRKALPTLTAWNLVERVGGTLRTVNGNYVAVGSGYPGTGPAGQTPTEGETWMFATGPVFALRSRVRVSKPNESIDRSENTVKMIGERTYVIGWNCCHAAVLVNLGVPVN